MEKLPSNNYEAWAAPQRQSPVAILIMLMQTAVNLLKIFWPVLILIFVRKKNAEDETDILFYVLSFGILTLIVTIIRFWFYRFHIQNDNLIIQTGWIQKKTLSVPLQNIHAVNLEQSLWQQLFKVAKVSLDSSGSEKTEVKIHALSIQKAELLKQLLSSDSKNKIPDIADASQNVAVHKLGTKDLLKLSLSANHLQAFVILLGVGLNILDDAKKIFNFDELKFFKTYAGTIANQAMVVGGTIFILIAVLSVLTSIIRTILKYYNFTMQKEGLNWKISFGLFTHQQKIIPFNKIQILSWKANWLRRKIDFWILHVQAIGHDKTRHKQHIQIPVTTLSDAVSLAGVYQQSAVLKPGEGLQIKSDYWKRRTLLTGLPVTIVLLIVLYFWIGLSGFWVLLFLIYFGWHSWYWYKTFRWQVNEEGLQLYSGVWGRKLTLLTWRKVQQIQLKQNLYQHSHQLASITFITAGGNVEIPYIKYETAKHLADYTLYLVESKNENWM